MNAEEWKALNDLLDAALDLAPEARSRWIDDLGPEHDALRDRLRRLLARKSHDSLVGTLPRLDIETDSLDEDDSTVGTGSPVGPYRLIRKLAQGGMGAVWLAERADGLIARPVALKLPRGAWHRASLLDRMAREREFLASLDHPHVGRLYDAGLTESGQPYLALEYVEGRHIDDYCRDRGLDVRARLQLFLQVLEAVAHAHSRLILHRDLKPSNILVTGESQVKLLDFGIAKLLTEGLTSRTELTEMSGRPLTPAYASPEQLSGEPLTTASDVYSLGVVLFELLAGVQPVGSSPEPRAGGAVSTDPAPLPPSAAARDPSVRGALRGDLDTIVLKALKHSPGERYLTVDGFADDLRRHLNGLPILARPDSTWYRLSKFVRRNTVAVGAAAAVILAVLAGAGAAIWQARVAFEQRERAEEVKTFITSIFEGANPYTAAGRQLSAVDVLEQAKRRIDRLNAATPEVRVELLTLVGASLADLTEVARAESILREAAAEATRTIGPDHELTLHARTALAQTHRFTSDPEAAQVELADLLPRLRASPASTRDYVEALESDASVAMSLGQWDRAEASSREMLEVAEVRLGAGHPLTLAAMWSLVQTYLLAGRAQAAAEAADRVFPLTVEAHRDEPKAPELIEARELYGRVLTGVGRLNDGIDHIRQALQDAAEVFGPSSLHIGYYATNLAARQLEVGDLDGALRSIDRGLEVSAVNPGQNSGLHAFAQHLRGQILLAARRGPAALAQLDAAIDELGRTKERANQRLADARSERALALAYTGRIAQAATDLADVGTAPSHLRIRGIVQRFAGHHASALDSQRQALTGVRPGPGSERTRSLILTEIGLDLLEQDRVDGADAALSEALALSRAREHRPWPGHADILLGLGRVRLAQRRLSEAVDLLTEADGFWRRFDPDSRWTGEAALWLGRAYEAAGRPADAMAAFSRAQAILSRSPLPGDAMLLRLARAG
jgi:eukaryotic-like serine/threonine-protein kinase